MQVLTPAEYKHSQIQLALVFLVHVVPVFGFHLFKHHERTIKVHQLSNTPRQSTSTDITIIPLKYTINR